MLDLITAKKGVAHVSPKNDAAIWQGITGRASGIFNIGNLLDVYAVGDTVYINDGLGMLQGRIFQVTGTETVHVDLPSTGHTSAYICVKIETAGDLQNASWEVLYGENVPTSQPAPNPTIPYGNIDNGETAYYPICSMLLNPSFISIHRVTELINGLDTIRYKSYHIVTKSLDSTVGSITVEHGLEPSAGMWKNYELITAFLTKNSDQSEYYTLPYVDPSHSNYTIGIKMHSDSIEIITGTSWSGYTANFVIGEL